MKGDSTQEQKERSVRWAGRFQNDEPKLLERRTKYWCCISIIAKVSAVCVRPYMDCSRRATMQLKVHLHELEGENHLQRMVSEIQIDKCMRREAAAYSK